MSQTDPSDSSSCSETDRAYTAAILDGEGTIGIARVSCSRYAGGFYFRDYVSVSNTRADLLFWLQKMWGGTVSGPMNPKNPRQKPVYRWIALSRKARAVLDGTLPYLKLKWPQAEALIRLAALRGPYQRTRTADRRYFASGRQRQPEVQAAMESIYLEVRRLNKRGR